MANLLTHADFNRLNADFDNVERRAANGERRTANSIVIVPLGQIFPWTESFSRGAPTEIWGRSARVLMPGARIPRHGTKARRHHGEVMEGLDEATMWLLALRDALDEFDVQLDTFEQTRAAVAMAGTRPVATETTHDRIEARLDSEMKAITRAMKLRHQD